MAEEVSAAALAEALSAAGALSAGQKTTYRDRARELVAPYARATLRQRLKDEVLPALLNGL